MFPLSYLFIRDRLVEIKESLELQNTEEQKIFEEEFEELGKYIKVFLLLLYYYYFYHYLPLLKLILKIFFNTKDQNTALEDALLHDRKDDSVDKALAESMPANNFEEEVNLLAIHSILHNIKFVIYFYNII